MMAHVQYRSWVFLYVGRGPCRCVSGYNINSSGCYRRHGSTGDPNVPVDASTGARTPVKDATLCRLFPSRKEPSIAREQANLEENRRGAELLNPTSMRDKHPRKA